MRATILFTIMISSGRAALCRRTKYRFFCSKTVALPGEMIEKADRKLKGKKRPSARYARRDISPVDTSNPLTCGTCASFDTINAI